MADADDENLESDIRWSAKVIVKAVGKIVSSHFCLNLVFKTSVLFGYRDFYHDLFR